MRRDEYSDQQELQSAGGSGPTAASKCALDKFLLKKYSTWAIGAPKDIKLRRRKTAKPRLRIHGIAVSGVLVFD
jgi:hypothetical protein